MVRGCAYSAVQYTRAKVDFDEKYIKIGYKIAGNARGYESVDLVWAGGVVDDMWAIQVGKKRERNAQ